MVAVLTKHFGLNQMTLAEDIVQDTLIEAIKNWSYKGIPENPVAWLYKVARNKAINEHKRAGYHQQYEAISRREPDRQATPDLAMFSEQEIVDDQLRMIFCCCHPSISSASQAALILKTLCGFSIAEIAQAFLTNPERIHKRLVRARRKIRDNRVSFEVPAGADLAPRLGTVLEAIYLLFNEGYKASSGKNLIRYDLCEEAIRLAKLITEHPLFGERPSVYALLSLMQLNASRFDARQDQDGNLLSLAEQDRSRWNYAMVKEGFINLDKAIRNGEISLYHLLASISACHCSARDFAATDWATILALYDELLRILDTPIVRLNRAIALAKVTNAAIALEELGRIGVEESLSTNHLYYSTLADFHMQLGHWALAISALEAAINYSPLESEKNYLRIRLKDCQKKMLDDVPSGPSHLS